ncbi:hypothetical protein WN72_14410 [Bradyrhizobium arachidis]|uniref:Uncharacterized protein n=1 Tax=Bradyrhizobium arachidis TaxID=858423 RepID=A0AAE7NRG4_9BRAD|nr:hypothetical protein WN72_14410 [Bradyrhizobium arachidis]
MTLDRRDTWSRRGVLGLAGLAGVTAPFGLMQAARAFPALGLGQIADPLSGAPICKIASTEETPKGRRAIFALPITAPASVRQRCRSRCTGDFSRVTIWTSSSCSSRAILTRCSRRSRPTRWMRARACCSTGSSRWSRASTSS